MMPPTVGKSPPTAKPAEDDPPDTSRGPKPTHVEGVIGFELEQETQRLLTRLNKICETQRDACQNAVAHYNKDVKKMLAGSVVEPTKMASEGHVSDVAAEGHDFAFADGSPNEDDFKTGTCIQTAVSYQSIGALADFGDAVVRPSPRESPRQKTVDRAVNDLIPGEPTSQRIEKVVNSGIHGAVNMEHQLAAYFNRKSAGARPCKYQVDEEGVVTNTSSVTAKAEQTHWCIWRIMQAFKTCRRCDKEARIAEDHCLYRVVTSHSFEHFTMCAILLNAVFLFHATNAVLYSVHAGTPVATWVTAIEYLFVTFYTVEITIKLRVYGCGFFSNADMLWNWLDLVIVLASIVEVFGDVLASGSGGQTPSYLRICRIFRIGKSFRVFKAMRFVKELRLLLNCVICSFPSLFWCSVFLTFLLAIFAVIIVQSISDFYGSDAFHSKSFEWQLDFEDAFAGVVNTMFSLFSATSGGNDWRYYYDMLNTAGGHTGYVFIFYVTFTTIAAMNIVTSIFIESAMSVSKPDDETVALQQERTDIADAKGLLDLLSESDANRDGFISLGEFEKFMTDERFLHFFRTRGIEIEDAELFYNMLQAITGDSCQIDAGTFVSGCMGMRGEAKSIDLHTVAFELKVMHVKQQHFMEFCTGQLGDMRALQEDILNKTILRAERSDQRDVNQSSL